jgi:DUF4097 and DUF4098 domain-containing protein YvlB
MTTPTKLPVFTFIAVIMSSVMLAGCIIHVGASDKDGGYSYDNGRDYSSTNKSVKVAEGLEVEDISSVNGSVTVSDKVSADEVSAVNGRIRIGDGVSVSSVEGVNGKIDIGSNFSAKESVETVNGNITIDENSRVGKNVETVNGNIKLEGVAVNNNLSTKNGNIYLTNNTVVSGDVIFRGKTNKNQSWKNSPPVLKVDETSDIKGKIIVYRDVEFDFADESMMSKVERR